MGQNSSKKTPIVPTPSEIPTNNGICVLPFPKSLTTNTTPTNQRTEPVSSRVAKMSEMSTKQRAEAVSSWVAQTTTHQRTEAVNSWLAQATTNISGHYTTTTVPHARKEIPKTESSVESFNKKLPALPPEANLNGPIAIVKPEKKPAPLIPLKPIIIEGSRFAEIKAEGLDLISLADRMDAMAILTTQGTTKQIQQQARVNGSVPKDKSKSFKYDHYGKLIDGHELGEDLKQETNVVAIDCEMVGVGELCDSALARVSIVNRYGFCIYDRFVKPRLPVTDYRTNKSGVREEDLVNAPDHYVVIEEVRSILHEKIVVGHSVHNDFEVLEFVHPEAMTRDTAIYYKELLHKKTSPSLKQLSNKYFNTKIQGGEHSSIVDAQVTMLLYSREELNWESSLNKQNETHMENPMPTKIPKIGVMTIYPRRDDLEGGAQYVRPIQVDTPYNCQQHYIDTMFRLLREDFMKPLREGYKQYLRWIQTRQSKDKPTTVRIFEGVKVNLGRGSLELKNVQQITIPMRQGNWDLSSTSEESRFLVNGSMLLFIPNTMYHSGGAKVATVMRANEDDDKRFAKQGILKVLFFPDGPSWTVQESTTFTVLESVAFFEAYRYALDSLQTLNLSKLPLGKYILNPTIPFGSVQSDFRSVDFSSQIVQLMPRSNGEYQYDGFPSSVQLGLSKGQYEAYHSAITKELALIQGPPGTGKTFIAMKIITFFLHNPALLAGRPILIVSNTNHSLDHLMEKVVNYATLMTGCQRRGDSLVLRIGGRSKSEIVTRVSMREKEHAYTRKTEAKTSLARARRNYILLQKLISIETQLQLDILETSKILKRAQDYLRDPEVKNVQKVLPAPDSAETKEARLRACLFEATESINGAIGSNNLVQAQLGCAKLQRTAALPLLMKVVEDKVKLLEKEVEELKDVTNIVQAMRAARVIGGTVCGFTKQKTRVLDKVKPALVIVEEAAHIIESTVVAGLTDYSKRLILIGDHKQLRPSTADHALTVANHLDVSIMERFVQTAKAQGLKTWSQLDVQRRMRPEIARLICPTIYTELYNDPSVNHFPDVKGMERNLFFVYHNERDQQEKDSMSYVNLMEAQFLTNLCLYLIEQGNEPKKITIITTYLGQKFEIENRMKRTKYSKDVRVCCVDGFQGEENDIILLSLVRSNDERNIGFLRTNNRVCVALSRARHGLYIVGNMHGLATRSPTWREINNTLMQGNNIGPLLRLKCVFHGGRITSVGMSRSHQQLDFMRNGTMNKCVCDLKQAQGRSTPTLRNSIIIQNSQLTATNSTFTVSLPQSRTLSAASSLSSIHSFQSTGLKGAEGQQTNGGNEKLGCGKTFKCGHFCNQKCKKPQHTGYYCLEPCIRVCNGGHKCPGNHHCYLPCQNLIKCEKKIKVACSKCSKMVNGVCSVLKPYYGKQSPLRHISGKTFCDACK